MDSVRGVDEPRDRWRCSKVPEAGDKDSRGSGDIAAAFLE